MVQYYLEADKFKIPPSIYFGGCCFGAGFCKYLVDLLILIIYSYKMLSCIFVVVKMLVFIKQWSKYGGQIL